MEGSQQSFVISTVRTGGAGVAEAPAAAKAEAAGEEEDDDDDAEGRAEWSLERRTAEELVEGLAAQWQAPMDALANAGKAFEGLEALLGGASGGSFDLKVLAITTLSVSCVCPADPGRPQQCMCERVSTHAQATCCWAVEAHAK